MKRLRGAATRAQSPVVAFPQSFPFAAPADQHERRRRLIWQGPEALVVDGIRRDQVISLAAVFFAVCGFAVALVFLRSALVHPSLALLVAVLSIELLLVPRVVRNERWVDFGGALVVTSLIGFVAVAAFLAGGLNQPIMGLAAAVPVLATVLLSPRAGLLVTFFLCALLSWFLALHLNGYTPALAAGGFGEDQTILRGCVLMLGTVLAAAAIWTYETQTQGLLKRYRLQYQHDVVTGQLNRWQFEIGLREQLGRSPPAESFAAMLLIDIDDFRAINAEFGPSVGDELLRRIGAAVQASVIGPHSLVGRMEGDCFALFCWCASRNTVRTLYDRIQLLVTGSVEDLPRRAGRPLSVSIGIGMLGEQECADSDAAERIYDQAAQALARAQSLGGNKVKFHVAAV